MRPKVFAALTIAVSLACANAAGAQTNVEVSQGIQFDFLNPGARSLAMGGAFVGLADDATAALSNPAGLRALSRTEVTVEGRYAQSHTPFLFGGRTSGTPSGLGIDTISSLITHDSETDEIAPSFVSMAFASSKRPFTLAIYRHQTSQVSPEIESDGAFNAEGGLPVIGGRYFSAIGRSKLRIANYGVSGSYRWQRCNEQQGQRTCQDVAAVGVGVSLYDFSIESRTDRYDFTTVDEVLSHANYQTLYNYQTEEGSEQKLGGSIGVLIAPSRRFSIGASYRYAPEFGFTGVAGLPGQPNTSTVEASFGMPWFASVGVAARLTDATVVLVDYQRVGYSRLGENTTELVVPFEGASTEYVSDDANELHFGLEHQFVASGLSPAIRVGAWYDPDHAVRSADGSNPFFRLGEDVWHYTGGFGVVVGRVELSTGVDYSDRGTIGSASFVVRF